MKSRLWWVGIERDRSQMNGKHAFSEPTSSGSLPA
jgi:hypothetical protein